MIMTSREMVKDHCSGTHNPPCAENWRRRRWRCLLMEVEVYMSATNKPKAFNSLAEGAGRIDAA